MAAIVLVTGGTRSGKSAYAQQWCEERAGARCFVATCVDADPEMGRRIEAHRAARNPELWHTLEEGYDLNRVLDGAGCDIYLIDCLTLWISNLMARHAAIDAAGRETLIAGRLADLIERSRQTGVTLVFVSNEVGLGIVPENPVAREFRDLVGHCNRYVAAAADEVVLICCGLPLFLKTSRTMT